MNITRQIIQVLSSRDSTDGDGVRIRRTLGQHHHDLDPFLMLDEIRSDNRADYVGGFPPHPHRGIETLTYMLSGGFVHEDSIGHREALQDGGAQWMFSGRGVIHSELPLVSHESTHEDLLHGFQLWINIPAAHKMDAPQYKQATREELPTTTLANGTQLRAFGGHWAVENHLLHSPLDGFSANARALEVTLPANTSLTLPLPPDDTALAYIFEGKIFEGSLDTGLAIQKGQLARFGSGEQLVLQSGGTGARLLLLCGTPLQEPIVQHGPFVMNTEAEIQQAIDDYRSGHFV